MNQSSIFVSLAILAPIRSQCQVLRPESIMTAKVTKKKVMKKIIDWTTNTFGGSGDIEKEDAIHIVDFLTTTYGTEKRCLSKYHAGFEGPAGDN